MKNSSDPARTNAAAALVARWTAGLSGETALFSR